METITVIEETIKQDKNGNDFANVKLEDGRYLNFMFDNYDAYEGLGHYAADISKQGKFWNVKPGTLESRRDGTLRKDNDPKDSKPKPDLKARLTSNTSHVDTNRSILVQVCIKAAAEVYNGTNLVENGQGLPVLLAGKFLVWAEKELNPKLEDAPF